MAMAASMSWGLTGTRLLLDAASSSSMANETGCPDGDQWIWHNLDQCIGGSDGWASFGVGMASISVWLIVLMPQIVQNFRDIRNAASIAWGLLGCWFLGDVNNFVGAVLTSQGLFQEGIGVWFVFTDIIFLGQKMYWYLKFKRKEKKALSSLVASRGTVVLCAVGLVTFLPWIAGSLAKATSYQSLGSRHGRILLSPQIVPLRSFFHDTVDIAGFAMGCLSGLLYTCSRLFQITKNCKRRDVTGLSLWTFVLCVVGNLLYGTAILVYSLDINYLVEHAPWIYGSFGIVLLDSVLIYQCLTYHNDFNAMLARSVNVDISSDDEDDEEARLLKSDFPEADQFGTLSRTR